jgi:hypothetical protein
MVVDGSALQRAGGLFVRLPGAGGGTKIKRLRNSLNKKPRP